MRLSIVIPVYQVEQYIAHCLSSVFDTASQDFEVVLINDGSKDKSMDIVRSFISGHKNIRLSDQQNQGLSSARMNGLGVAEGDYIWFIDSDDYLLPGSVDQVLEMISVSHETDVFAFPLLWRYDDGGKDRTDYVIPEPGVSRGKDILKDGRIPAWAAPRFIIKRELFDSEDLCFPQGLMHEDEYFCRVLLYKAERVMVMDKPVYVYRQRNGSIMKRDGAMSAKNLVEVYKRLSLFADRIAPEDYTWFRKDILCLLLETHTRNLSIVRTESFKNFRCEYLDFILNEFNRHNSCLSFKDRWLGNLLLRCPYFYSKLIPGLVRLKHIANI